ncbi:hypothetical protein LEP1GSC058_3080 [Leptospira fainei serovar Hurstbridge str. BUT 6]|uniref:Uncharacterized protein n=1 Tax=Leptospira fainei serovar Hurstbridge str. BUT 6 TaxID=1193011 RepID=S3VCT5_9LEPT|nr:hypothetical protein LEP1GSC058_3080 [Leptospira fainei serovar Hurstbridge str. BUT 6]
MHEQSNKTPDEEFFTFSSKRKPTPPQILQPGDPARIGVKSFKFMLQAQNARVQRERKKEKSKRKPEISPVF